VGVDANGDEVDWRGSVAMSTSSASVHVRKLRHSYKRRWLSVDIDAYENQNSLFKNSAAKYVVSEHTSLRPKWCGGNSTARTVPFASGSSAISTHFVLARDTPPSVP
jgi:hypothetical protein